MAQPTSRSHFVSYQPSAAITDNVPALHLPADTHVAYRMFIFIHTAFKKCSMYVVWHDGGKCILLEADILPEGIKVVSQQS